MGIKRQYSINPTAVEKAVLEVYAKLGITLPEKYKSRKSPKLRLKTLNIWIYHSMISFRS